MLKIFIILLVLDLAAIAIAEITGHPSLMGLIPLFHMSHESNFPTYFSSIFLLLISLIVLVIYISHRRKGLNDSKYWIALSVIFLLVSMDEFMSVHELFTMPLREAFQFDHWFYFAWVIPGIIFCAVLLLFFLKFFFSLPGRYKRLFFASAFLLIGGAIGMEILDGLFISYNESSTFVYGILSTLEETMEFLGIILFAYSFIDYLNTDTEKGGVISIPEGKTETA